MSDCQEAGYEKTSDALRTVRRTLPKFSDTFSETQRRAAIGYAIAHRSVPKAIRAAAAGGLPECPEPFEISKSYLSELVRDEKERRLEGAPRREANAAELADDIMRRELKRLDRASRSNRLNAVKAREMLRALRELDAIARKAPGANGGGDQDPDPDAPAEPEQPAGIIERLVAAQRAEQHDAQDPEGEDTGDDVEATTGATTNEPTTDTSTTAVRARAENLRALREAV